MTTPLSGSEFKYWQDKFSLFWDGRSRVARQALSEILGPIVFDFDKGAIFCVRTGSTAPTCINHIEVNGKPLVLKNRYGRFAAIDQGFVIQLDEAALESFCLPFDDCLSWSVSWPKNKIIIEITVQRFGLLKAIMNTYQPNNLIEKLQNLGIEPLPFIIDEYKNHYFLIGRFLERII